MVWNHLWRRLSSCWIQFLWITNPPKEQSLLGCLVEWKDVKWSNVILTRSRIPHQLQIVDPLSGCLEKSSQPFGNCVKTKMRIPSEMHFHLPSHRKKRASQKAPMPLRWMRRRKQDRQRRCHHQKLSQRRSNPGKVMVKEKGIKGISLKGRLQRAKLNLRQRQRVRQKPKVSLLYHVYSSQRVRVTEVQNVPSPM